MDTTKTITHIGLCAGYGGIELGLKRVIPTLRSVALCEIEAFAIANLVAKMEAGLMEPAPIWTDLKTFPWAEFRGRVDILTGGYPCQPFSAAGKRLGTDDPRHLWPFIAGGIRILQPRMCFFENVEGHISLGLREVIGELEQMGYKVSWGIFSAREVGAPHQRKRVFILAHHSNKGLQGGEWCWQAGTQGQPSGYLAECGSSMANSIMWGMSGSRNELGDFSETRQGWTHLEENSYYGNKEFMADPTNRRGKGVHDWNTKSEDVVSCCAWPSRPGEPQHAWEPPRVVWSRMANSNELRLEEHGLQHTDLSIGSSGGQNPEAMGNASELFSDGSNNHARISERSEEISKSRDSSWQKLGDSDHGRLASCLNAGSSAEADRGGQGDIEQAESWQTQPAMGRDADGPAGGLGYAELQVSCDNRTDELRLLGNGVVPATAERAFRVLIEEINK